MEGDSSNENLHFIQVQVSIGSADTVTKWYTHVLRIDYDQHSCETKKWKQRSENFLCSY